MQVKVAMAVLAAVFAVEVYRAAERPIGTGEAYLYDRLSLIQNPSSQSRP